VIIRWVVPLLMLLSTPVAASAAVETVPTYDRAGYTPKPVPVAAVPYNDLPLDPRQATGTVDATGVRMFAHPDITSGQLMNHPVAQAQYGLRLLNTYRVTKDPWFLDRAQRQAQRLVDTHVESRGAWWLPYPFNFSIGGTLLTAPWYSQMAQGVALSLFVRLHDVTGNAAWKTPADGLFASFLLDPAADQPWGVWTDAGGYLWLEEYPRWLPGDSERVLNGHLFALYGLWDYWRATGSSEAAALFDGALTTANRYVPSGFRNPAWASNYSLRSDLPHLTYHGIHVDQLHHAHALTGAARFADLGDMLHQDYPPPLQSGSLRFAASAHTGVKFDSTNTGRVTARKTITLSGVSSAPFDQRRRVFTQPGYWYHVTAGALDGYFVQEVRSVRAAKAPVSSAPYFGPRRVLLQQGTYSAYTATGSKTITLNAASAAPVSRIGWLNGRLSVLVSSGTLTGYWLPLTSGVTLR
jgi:hypothetical protein